MPSKWNLARDGGLTLTLTGDNNHTLQGTIHLQNSNLLQHLVNGDQPEDVTTQAPRDDYDPKGASAYAIVVIFVYGFSIVLLIASHIFLKKKEDKKDGENEKEINKYLEQAPQLQRHSEKESFRKLKRSIIPLVSVGMMAAGVNDGTGPGSTRSDRRDNQRIRHNSRGSQTGTDDDEDDQVAPLLTGSPFNAKKSFVFDEDLETTLQLPSNTMPTIFEGSENESMKSQESDQSKEKRHVSDNLLWNPKNISQNIDQRQLPRVHSPRSNLYGPPTVRILESKRQVPGPLQNSVPMNHTREITTDYNTVQCPRELLKCADEKLLQVTVL